MNARHRSRVIVLVAICLLSCGLLWCYWHAQGVRDYGPDEGTYSYVGWAWSHGLWPYRDCWDHKGPTVYLVTMIRSLLAGGPDSWAIGIQEIGFGAETAVLLGCMARLLWGGLAPALGVLFGVLLWVRGGPSGGHMSTPGSIIGFLTTATLLVALIGTRSRSLRGVKISAVLVGVLGSLAFCTKPNAISGLVLGLALLLTSGSPSGSRTKLLLVGLVMLGATLPIAFFAIWFHMAGALSDLIDACFNFNQIRGRLLFSQTSSLDWVKAIIRSIADHHLLAPLTAILVVGCLHRRSGMPRSEWLLVVGWLAVELMILASNGGYGHHAYTVYPPVALGCVWIVLLPWIRTGDSRFAISQSLALSCLLVVPALPDLWRLRPPSEPKDPTLERVIADVQSLTTDNDRILAPFGWSGTQVLCRARRLSASRYIYPMPLYVAGYASEGRWRQLLDTLAAEPPPAVVLVPGELDEEVRRGNVGRYGTDKVYPSQLHFIHAVGQGYSSKRIGKYSLYVRKSSLECESKPQQGK